jgi:hypothetical protein
MGIEFERKKKTKEDEIVKKKKNLKNDPKQNNY